MSAQLKTQVLELITELVAACRIEERAEYNEEKEAARAAQVNIWTNIVLYLDVLAPDAG